MFTTALYGSAIAGFDSPAASTKKKTLLLSLI